MPRIISTSIFLTLVLALAASMVGCASITEGRSTVEGPTFSVHGRISVRKIGEPLQASHYSWNRGRGINGWTESIDFTDPRGLVFLAISSDDTGTTARYLDRTIKVPNVRYLLRTEMGIDLEPSTLASWLENDYAGEQVPDKFSHENVHIEIVERDGKGRPYKVLMREAENLVVMVVRREFNE